MRIQPGRLMAASLITLVLASALQAGPAVTVGASTAAPGPLPVLYNLGGGTGSAWNLPQVRPRKFFIFADGSAALIGMHWARWTRVRAVTRQAVYYHRTGPCCTSTDQHRHKVTVTLSRVRHRGGPRRGPYFVRMVITGHHFRTRTLTYTVLRAGGQVFGSWLSRTSASVTRPGSAVLLPAGLQLYLAPPCVRRQGAVRRPVRQHCWLLDRPRHARRLGGPPPGQP